VNFQRTFFVVIPIIGSEVEMKILFSFKPSEPNICILHISKIARKITYRQPRTFCEHNKPPHSCMSVGVYSVASGLFLNTSIVKLSIE